MAASPIGEMGDFLKAFPQYTERDYMYKLSVPKIQFQITDSSHVKYLEGKDKEIWKGVADANEAYSKALNFLNSLKQKQ